MAGSRSASGDKDLAGRSVHIAARIGACCFSLPAVVRMAVAIAQTQSRDPRRPRSPVVVSRSHTALNQPRWRRGLRFRRPRSQKGWFCGHSGRAPRLVAQGNAKRTAATGRVPELVVTRQTSSDESRPAGC